MIFISQFAVISMSFSLSSAIFMSILLSLVILCQFHYFRLVYVNFTILAISMSFSLSSAILNVNSTVFGMFMSIPLFLVILCQFHYLRLVYVNFNIFGYFYVIFTIFCYFNVICTIFAYFLIHCDFISKQTFASIPITCNEHIR
jgi:hypothetical protein